MARPFATRCLIAATLVAGLAVSAAPSAADATAREREASRAQRVERVEPGTSSANWLARFARLVQRLVAGSGTLKEGAGLTGGGHP